MSESLFSNTMLCLELLQYYGTFEYIEILIREYETRNSMGCKTIHNQLKLNVNIVVCVLSILFSFIFVLRLSYMNIVFTSFSTLTLTPSLVQDLWSIIIVSQGGYAYRQPLSSSTVLLIHMCLGLITWDQKPTGDLSWR